MALGPQCATRDQHQPGRKTQTKRGEIMFEVTKTGQLISTGQLVRLGDSNVYASVNPGEGSNFIKTVARAPAADIDQLNSTFTSSVLDADQVIKALNSVDPAWPLLLAYALAEKAA